MAQHARQLGMNEIMALTATQNRKAPAKCERFKDNKFSQKIQVISHKRKATFRSTSLDTSGMWFELVRHKLSSNSLVPTFSPKR